MYQSALTLSFLLLSLLFAPLAGAADVQGLTFNPPRDVGTAKTQYYLGEFENLERYTPWDIAMPVAFITPSDDCFTPEDPARLIVFLHPDDGGNGHFVRRGWAVKSPRSTIELRNQEDSFQEGRGGWWGYSGGQVGKVGNYNGERIATSIDYLLDRFGDRIDLDRGIIMRGTSLGGTGVILQSMILPRHRDNIAIVDATVANILFAKCCQSRVRKSWAGQSFDPADFRLHAQELANIHFFSRGGSNDKLGVFDLEFFEICEAQRISCAGTWLRSGHNFREKGYNLSTNLFLDRNQDARLDQVLPVITKFTGNHHGAERGHHNRGISWDQSGIVDTPEGLRIPLKYIAMKDIGEALPDQPERVTFSVTPRRVENFDVQPGDRVNWVFGEQSGTLTVPDDGLMTISGLQLNSADRYTLLVLSDRGA